MHADVTLYNFITLIHEKDMKLYAEDKTSLYVGRVFC